MEQTNQNLFDLQIDHQSISQLNEAAKWGKFLAIMGFIFCGLFVVIALFAGTFMASMMSGFGGSEAAGVGAAMGGGIITFAYILIALIYFFPCLYLFNFSTKMQAALRSNQQDTLNTSFRNLKSCFKFLGILMIIGLCFWVLAIIIAVAAAIGGGV
ncbi:MAG: hypothetical protein H7122_04405 [Chitinophagaceae bacterium]|nr:hypothetical protein [Chitinophagaceae bacterium]